MRARARGGAQGVTQALVQRDLWRWRREPSRWLGLLAQPLLFWWLLGSGLGPMVAAGGGDASSYLTYFYPGILLLVLVFASVAGMMSLIEDRASGFMQAVLVAPAPPVALVLGKVGAVVLMSMVQSAAFVALAPAAGWAWTGMAWWALLVGLVVISATLATWCFALAWWLNTTQGFHAFMSVLLLPLWVLSGAMFPAPEGGAWRLIALNPLASMSTLLRAGLGESASGVLGAWLVVCALLVGGLWVSARLVARTR